MKSDMCNVYFINWSCHARNMQSQRSINDYVDL